MQQRSDAKGLLHLAGHLVFAGVSAWLVYAAVNTQQNALWISLAMVFYGFTLVTMFAMMHETVHRTAFKSAWLNNCVAWFAGLMSFYNGTFYRHYHGWHHRFTQIPGKDPELDDPKPTNLPSYVIEMSGFHWWVGKIRTYAKICSGRAQDYPYLNAKTQRQVMRSVRAQCFLYATAIAVSLAAWQPWFLFYWLLPVALAQPLLRGLVLAEHTLCTNDDNALTNTRTTHTNWLVRFLMWNMPYHAEHHRYPALPFHRLAQANQKLEPQLAHVGKNGYLALHLGFFRHWSGRRSA
ncbi:MAG: fatty acid desaturase [Deltaproteobacteria bacterium]|nr:fatty acid desaturase [Deltaproteobacteria bacterium]